MENDARYDLLDGAAARSILEELSKLFVIVYAEPPYSSTDEDLNIFRQQFGPQSETEGFCLVTARSGDSLLGFSFGVPLAATTAWWSRVLTPLPADVTAEWPGRTLAVIEMGVRPEWRRRGVARMLHDLLLRDRTEERGTLTVHPEAIAAQAAYRRWGWTRIAQTRNPLPGDPIFDVLIKPLR